ncbi:MAG: hypothetical protein M0R46_01495 [Candidatus Muirbacterium halophilum]|nr:hypothetical protein [Candidatus Muirbacterium halophilum]MCK9474569.1 hypothetical protein [Candidatus Muirbacterium halophilum]
MNTNESNITKKINDAFRLSYRDRLDYILEKKAEYYMKQNCDTSIKYSLKNLIEKN